VAGPLPYTLLAEAVCPVQHEILGLGGYLNGGAPGFGQLSIEGLVPTGNPWRAFLVGREDETGFAGNWFPVAYAICAY
jgi:hypothetical protein